MLLRFFRRLSRLYFRDIEVVGNVPSAATGGRLFAANHVNGLVDPLLVLSCAPCPMSPLAKSTLWKIPVLRQWLDALGAVPVVRRKDDPGKSVAQNDAIFDAVARHLGGGGNVLIFPEGTSHNEPHLMRLRTGAGRMLTRAHEAGAEALTFQAVGLEFETRDRFRSRALVVYGPVRSVSALAAAAPVGALSAAIMDQLAEDLSELIVEGATWEEHRLIARVASLFAHDGGDPSLRAWNELGRQVEAARKSLRPDQQALYDEVARAVSAYFDALEEAEVTDAQVATATAAPRRRRRTSIVLAPLAALGVVLYALPYRVPRLLARRLSHGDADEVSTYKLATSIVVFPLWTALLCAAACAALRWPWSALASAAIALSPFAALRWLDRRRAPRRPALDAPHLRALREQTMAVLRRARAEVGAPGSRGSRVSEQS